MRDVVVGRPVVKATKVRRRVALAGRVVDGATGSPVAGAAVELTAVPEELERRRAAGKGGHGSPADHGDNVVEQEG